MAHAVKLHQSTSIDKTVKGSIKLHEFPKEQRRVPAVVGPCRRWSQSASTTSAGSIVMTSYYFESPELFTNAMQGKSGQDYWLLRFIVSVTTARA